VVKKCARHWLATREMSNRIFLTLYVGKPVASRLQITVLWHSSLSYGTNALSMDSQSRQGMVTQGGENVGPYVKAKRRTKCNDTSTQYYCSTLLEVLRKYKNSLKQDAQPEFDFLIRGLVSAVIYCAITIQHIIQYLLVAIKLQIETDCQKRQEALSINGEKESELCSSVHSSSATSTPTAGSNDSTPRKLCYANKCRILLAKGILRAPVPCAKGRNICPGCILESARQRKTAMVENDII